MPINETDVIWDDTDIEWDGPAQELAKPDPIKANTDLLSGFMADRPMEARETVAGVLDFDAQEEVTAKAYYDNKFGTNHPPALLKAQIEYEYGEGTTAKTANSQNKKAAKVQKNRFERLGTFAPVGIKPNIFGDAVTSFARKTAAKVAIAPKMVEEQQEARRRIADKLGVPEQYREVAGEQLAYFKDMITPANLGPVRKSLEWAVAAIPEDVKERVANFAFKQSEKAGEVQSQYMSGVPFEESIAKGDLKTAGGDLMTSIAFESPNLAVQLGLARINPALSMTYMGAGAAAEKRTELGESDDMVRNVVQPYISGLLEIGTEKYVGTGRIIDRVAKNEIIEGAMQKLATIGLDFLGGAASEGSATLGGNLLDMAFGDDVGAFEGVALSTAVGAVMDTAVSTASQPWTLGDANRVNKQNTEAEVDTIVEEADIPAEQKPLMKEMIDDPTDETVGAFNAFEAEEEVEGGAESLEISSDQAVTKPEDVQPVVSDQAAMVSAQEYPTLTPKEICQGHCFEWANSFASTVSNGTVKDVDLWPLRGQANLPYHVWTEINGRAYDAEATEGVDNWQDLPYFKRHENKKAISELDERDFPQQPEKVQDAIQITAQADQTQAEGDTITTPEGAGTISFPDKLYHQTSSQAATMIESDGFRIDKQNSSKGDALLPNGVFLKPTPEDIGLGGMGTSVQLETGTSVNNPLVVDNRDVLSEWALEQEGYADINKDLETIDDIYGAIDEEISTKMSKRYEKIYNEGGDITADAEYEALSEKIKENVADWRGEVYRVSEVSRNFITDKLQELGYDSVHIVNDEGSLGRKTESIVILDPKNIGSSSVYTQTAPAPSVQEDEAQPVTAENAKQGDIIGISRASNNEFRETFGATELDETAREKQTETMQKAKDDGIIDRADVLARVIDAEPRELKAEEVAGFMMRKAQLANQIESLQEQIAETEDVETLAVLNAQLDPLINTAETLTRAVAKGAAKNARALAAMAMHMDRKSFSLVNIVYEMGKQAPLTEEDRADAKRLAAEMKVEDDAVARLEAEYDAKLEAEAQKRAEEIVAKTLEQRTTVQRRNKAQTKRNEGKAALKKLKWEVNDVTGVPFKVAQALKDIAVSHIMDGATTLDEVVKRVQKDVPDARVTSKVIYDSLGGRVKKEAKKARREAETVIAELKTQAKLKGEIADAMEGVFDPTKTAKPSSAEIKELRSKLKEYRESHLKTETDEAQIEAISERIDKIDDMIERVYRPVKSIKTKSKQLKEAEAKLKVKNAELTAQDRIAMLEDLLRSDVQVSEVDASESETSARLETFRAKIAVLERLRQAQIKESGQEAADIKKAKADAKALADSISDLTREIETFTRDIKPNRRKAETPAEKKALQIEKRRQDQVSDLLETIRKQKVSEKVAKTVTEDRNGFEAMKKNLRENMRKEAWYQDQMELRELAQVEIEEAELDRRLAENDFEGFVTPKQEHIIKNDDLIRAKIRRNDKRREINRRINDQKPKTWADHLSTIYEVPRSLKLSFDVGHIGRQAGWSLSNPYRVNPIKYAGESIAAFWKQETADRMELRVLESPYYAQGVQAGLQLPSDIQQVGEVEWIYSGEFMKNKTGWLGKGLAMSERTQVASIKVLRMGLFEGFMERHPETTAAEQKDVAEYINITTGYGMGRTVDGFSKAFEKLMTSPRFTSSRYQTALMPVVGAVKYRGNKNLQKEVLQDSGWFYGVRAALLILFGLAFRDKEDFVDVGMNPDNHTFGRIIINLENGTSHVYDPWSGVQRTARIAPALIRGEKDVLAAALGDLAKSAHPTLTGTAHVIAGTKYPSEDVTRLEALARMFSPIPFEAAVEGVVAATEGDPLTANAIALMFDIIGIGSYTMETKDLKKKTRYKDRKRNK